MMILKKYDENYFDDDDKQTWESHFVLITHVGEYYNEDISINPTNVHMSTGIEMNPVYFALDICRGFFTSVTGQRTKATYHQKQLNFYRYLS